MPKTKPLIRDEKAERAETRRKLIQSKMGARDIRSQVELARRSGISEHSVCSKLHSGAWTADDLAKLDKALRFSAEELAAIVRGGNK